MTGLFSVAVALYREQTVSMSLTEQYYLEITYSKYMPVKRLNFSKNREILCVNFFPTF